MNERRNGLWLLLLALAFLAGLMAARLTEPPPPPSTPNPPTPLPATPTPPPTPTAVPSTADGLETLYLEVAPADWARVLAKREEALQRGILVVSKKDYVPATLRFGDTTLPAEIRLKGDWIDHLFYDKWSFRVHMTGDGAFHRMKLFSLQDPGRRSYLNDWLFLNNLHDEDVLAVRYRFVHLVLNGEAKGIYAVEESFAKELLESQERREGPIIRWDEDLLWTYRALYDDQLIPRSVDQYHLLDTFQSARIAANPTLAAEAKTAEGMLRAVVEGRRPASEIFDIEAMGRFLALTDLWCAPHGLIWHNLRYYYDPVAARLEPIAYDSDALDCDLSMAGLPQGTFYGDPKLQASYLHEAWRVSDPAYLEKLQSRWVDRYEALRQTLLPEFGEEALTPPWGTLKERQRLMRQVLRPYRTLYAFIETPNPPHLPPGPTVTLAVGNLLDYPLVIDALQIDEQRIPPDPAWITSLAPTAFWGENGELILRPLPEQAGRIPYLRLILPRDLLPKGARLRVVTHLWGLEEEHKDPILRDYPAPLDSGPRPTAPTLTEALQRYPFLHPITGTQMLTIIPGTWTPTGDLILPHGYGLQIPAGTTLRFREGTILFIEGPLRTDGTEEAPVQLLPQESSWGGLIVLNAAAPSFLHHTLISATTGITRTGWFVSGGTTFYQSPVRITGGHFLYSQAEDALNIVRGEFELTESEFGWDTSDALDVDFGHGNLDTCTFHDIGGDGVDVSGTEVELSHLRMQRIADKGISAGEISHVIAHDLHLADLGFGIVSKDLSRVEAERITITRPAIAALAVYIKKETYGPATLTANAITFVETPDNRRTLVQAGCTLRLEGELIPGTDVDVGALYGP